MIEPPDPAEKTENTASNSGLGPSANLGPALRPAASTNAPSYSASSSGPLTPDPRDLQRQVRELNQEIAELQETRDRLIKSQAQGVQDAVAQLVEGGLTELEQRRKSLQTSIDQLERRQERIQAEMRKSFVGVSQDLAVRVQGFKEYLVGSLQDLAATAEQLELGSPAVPMDAPMGTPLPRQRSPERGPATGPVPLERRPPLERRSPSGRQSPSERQPLRSPSRSSRPLNLGPPPGSPPQGSPPQGSPSRGIPPQGSSSQGSPPRETSEIATSPTASSADDQADRIRQLLDQYRTMPNYYGRPWQLRRTFEPVHAERVSQWFFELGRRGAIKTMGSRLQNVLIASAVISALREIHGDRVRALILGDSPERLGEWRRGLQDCLGISRTDFGAQRGVVLFEASEAVAQRAERLVEQGQMPLILIDEGEDKVSLSLLQFPLWLAFAPDPADTLPLY